MSKLDDLRDQFDTTELLDAVDQLDTIRGIIADGDNLEPPQIRTDLLKLHGLAMHVVNEGYPPDEDFYDLASDIEFQIDDIVEAVEKIQQVVSKLVQLCPSGDEWDDEDVDD